MKKLFVFLFPALFSFLDTIAQNNLPPVYEITADTAQLQKIDSVHWQILEDPESKWTINQVSQAPLSDKFHYVTKSLTSIDPEFRTYWFCYRLKNVKGGEAMISLASWSDQTDFYIFKGNIVQNHFTTGNKIPWSKKDGIKKLNDVPIILEPGEEFLIYCRIYNDKPGVPRDLMLNFYNTGKRIQNVYLGNEAGYVPISTIQYFFFAGFLLLAALFNFFFFRSVKERVYLYFALTLLFLCFPFPVNPILEATLAREHPRLAEYLTYIGIFWLFFLIHFVRHFLQTYRYFPRWDKFLFILSFVQVVSDVVIGYLLNYTAFDKFPPFIFLMITILSLVYTFFLSRRVPGVLSRYFKIAILPFLSYFCLTLLLFITFNSLKIPLPGFMKWMQKDGALLIGYLTISWAILFFSLILFKRYEAQKKEITQQAVEKERLAKEREIERNALIAQQKENLEKEVTQRTAELKHSLEELKATQSQLIQSEKMASLGELTAGIAHEIQNPLNFVNNFSEVNKELVIELGEEIDKGNYTDAKAIAKNIQDNEEKINHHGKRADAIVKGMLQHSRISSGIKEPTNINALADEYLRLAYHGLRAKDKSFNVTMKTEFDETIGLINIVPQDIGRVILNLITNAFYAASQNPPSGGSGAEPTVWVSTKKEGDKVLISVRDNGPGIPQKILDKIFQPFFTTKPTGQGTGLGLSLSYDIVKAHSGEIKVESKEGEGSGLIIILPVN